MAREQLQTLSEPMYYTLLALTEECCGVDIMERVKAISRGRVTVGPGTLYHLLDQFCEAGMIRETKNEGRRRSYILTAKGEGALQAEVARMQAQMQDYRMIFGEEEAK